MSWRHSGDKPLSEPVMEITKARKYASLDLNELNNPTVSLFQAISGLFPITSTNQVKEERKFYSAMQWL